ncbi:hypothetical protein Ocepr_0285 [Oceanithermus profundus DSM 14977]|uniref:Bacterial repeat domain-containing protein n=1 Tax=Oceanithermus profundus (strain DSM 14977 / NBRC 100410 / VKM B-2274 / 506) TaxID=670487 RepID=E4U6K7_OCEP5|nr:hypothetical protein [Oceanithermus profundus]ADR35745.1 hypothetical protein Ocepr_0285 [Oceanithermus profundus DSM 14977]
MQAYKRSYTFGPLLLLGLVSLLAACQGATAPQSTLELSFSGSGSGKVRITPPDVEFTAGTTQSYAAGTQVTLTATPDAGSTFLGWSGDCSGSGSCVLTLDTDKRVTASFSTQASGALTVYGPGDFNGNTLTVQLPGLQPADYVALIPVYAGQDSSGTDPDGIQYAITTQNVATASLGQAADAGPAGPRVPSDAAALQASRAFVAEARSAGIEPLNRQVGAQGFSDNCPGPYQAGVTQCDFWVFTDVSTSPPTQALINATVQYVSASAVWFVEDGLTGDDVLSASELGALANTFETAVWPTIGTTFGNAADFDGNGKIFIVLSPKVGNAGLFGYVYSADLYLDSGSAPRSNEGDIFYATTPGPPINLYSWTRDAFLNVALPGTMAHELKHLVAMGYRVAAGFPLEEIWIEEPSAEVAKELSGFGTAQGRIQSRASDALANPEAFRIVHATRPSGAEGRAIYGFNFLLMWRAHEKVGASLWKPWVQSNLVGIANFEAATGQSFADALVDWALTLLFDDTARLAGYEYQNLALRDGSWQTLYYQPLAAVSNRTLRSMAFYVGRGTGADATVTLSVSDPSRMRVAVVRFAGPLPY